MSTVSCSLPHIIPLTLAHLLQHPFHPKASSNLPEHAAAQALRAAQGWATGNAKAPATSKAK